MPKDAKFGLVLGLGCVMLIAVMFFHKEPARPVRAPGAPAVSSAPVGTPKLSATGTTSRADVQGTATNPVLYSVAPARQPLRHE